MFPHPHFCDTWEPTENIETDGSVETPTYTLKGSDLPSNFQARGRAKRLFSGLDVTQAGRRLYLYGLTEAQSPSARALFVNVNDGTVWRADGPPEWYQTPVSAGHFEVDLTLELTPPDEVSAAYP